MSGHQSTSSLTIYMKIKESKKEAISLDICKELELTESALNHENVDFSDNFTDILGDQWLLNFEEKHNEK